MEKAIYSAEELKRIQEIELEALRVLANICEVQKIEYFIIGGTALGAVRHGGFIPWDDDIDIGMTRENYMRLLEEVPSLLPEKYSLQFPKNERKTPYPYAKLRVNGTKFVEYENHRLKINHGIYIDIFPFDEVPDDDRENEEHFSICRKYIELYVYRQSPRQYKKVVCLKDFVKYIAKKILFMALHCISFNWLLKKIDSCITKYNGTDTKAMACLYFPKRKVEYIEKQDLYPLSKINFEGMLVNAPNNYDRYLRTHYGEYMQLPNEADRISHRPYIVQL